MTRDDFVLDNYYQHPKFGRMRYVAYSNKDIGYFRNGVGDLAVFQYSDFEPPKPPTVTVTLRREDAERLYYKAPVDLVSLGRIQDALRKALEA